MPDSLTSELSFFGRILDDLTREPAPRGSFRFHLESPTREAFYRQDDYFVFQDLTPSASAYHFLLSSSLYQARRLDGSFPGPTPVELSLPGEDELMLRLTGVDAATQRITFDVIGYLPPIRRGARVLGPGAATTTLKEDLAGVDVDSAVLDNVAGLSTGSLVRILRSSSLVAKAGPYYPFPSGSTVVAIRVTENPSATPLPKVRARITEVNASPLATTLVGGMQVNHTPTPPIAGNIVLGRSEDLESFSDARGNLVFYFAASAAISGLKVQLSLPGYINATQALPIATGARNSFAFQLSPS